MLERKFFAFEKAARADLPPGWTVVGLTSAIDNGREIVMVEAEQDPEDPPRSGDE